MPIPRPPGAVLPAQELENMTLTALSLRGISHKPVRSIFQDCGYGSRYYWRCRLDCIEPGLASECMGLIWKC
jgi:hypothetical protein